MGEYAAFLLILVFGFACGYGTARARGEKQPKAELPEISKIRIEDGDTVILRYKGLLTREQRTALKQMMEGWFKDHARNIIVLEAGLEVEVVKGAKVDPEPPPAPPTRYVGFPDGPRKTEEARAQWEADMKEWQRRRDDNRAQRAPEEPWQ